jgi:DNA (cytosine-5)-methyltransferase 1
VAQSIGFTQCDAARDAGQNISPTLRSGGDGGYPAHSVAYGIPGNWIGRKPENGGNATSPMNNVAPCLTKTDMHGVAYSFDSLASNSMKSSNPHSGCRKVELSKTIDTTYPCPSKNQGGIGIMQSMAVRRLTPVECERLQGFPDNYTNIKENCPDGPRYKAMGNSMAVPVMRWIGERINKVNNEQ